jgi:hypothetical protein
MIGCANQGSGFQGYRNDLYFKNANGSTGMTLVQEGGAWKLGGE